MTIDPAALRALRRARDLTQPEAARLMGIGLRTWEKYEARGCPLNFWRACLWVCAHGQKLNLPLVSGPPQT